MAEVKRSNIIVVSFLITGTTIGSGLLALPICIGLGGIVPGVIILVATCVFMAATGFVLAGIVNEKKDISFDLPSIYEGILGKSFKWVAIVANFIVLYGLLVAYLACLTAIAEAILDTHLFLMPLIIFLVITSLNFFAMNIISKGNAILVVILFLSFFVLVLFTGAHIKMENFRHLNWLFVPLSLPILVNSFNFHNVIPSACQLLNFEKKRTYIAISLGVLFSFIITVIWCFAVIGSLRYSDNTTLNIVHTFKNNLPATVPLGHLFRSIIFSTAAVLFAAVAIITSYWAIGLALTNFIRDLRRHYSRIDSHIFDILLAFLPPLIITIICPHVFISVQSIVGGIGIAILFGLLPSIIFLKRLSGFKKILPIIMIIFFSIVVLFRLVGWLE